MTLCEKLIDLRRKAGLSQEQMAQQLDVSRQAVSKWETGESLPQCQVMNPNSVDGNSIV